MEYEAFKLKNIIFTNRYRLGHYSFSFSNRNDSLNKLIILDVGNITLTVAQFFKYRELTSPQSSVEEYIHKLISKTSDPYILARVASKRKWYLYDEIVPVMINGKEYNFKIDGIGEWAVKISMEVTYDEIAASQNPLERILKNVIEIEYSYKFNDEYLLEEIDKKWEEEIAYKKFINDEVFKEDEEILRKRRELEEFLKKEID